MSISLKLLSCESSVACVSETPRRITKIYYTIKIWFNLYISRSWVDEASPRVRSPVSAAIRSVYEARSTLDLVRTGGASLELFVFSGFVDGLLAAEALRGAGRGC